MLTNAAPKASHFGSVDRSGAGVMKSYRRLYHIRSYQTSDRLYLPSLLCLALLNPVLARITCGVIPNIWGLIDDLAMIGLVSGLLSAAIISKRGVTKTILMLIVQSLLMLTIISSVRLAPFADGEIGITRLSLVSALLVASWWFAIVVVFKGETTRYFRGVPWVYWFVLFMGMQLIMALFSPNNLGLQGGHTLAILLRVILGS